jgi:MYXO-CTERM domain-containing protein
MRTTTAFPLLAVLLVAGEAGANHAGPMTLRLVKRSDTPNGSTPLTDTEFMEWWNKAACDCHREIGLEMELTMEPQTNLGTEEVQIWSGTQCNEFTTERDARCEKVGSIVPFDLLRNRQVTVFMDTAKIMFPNLGDAACPEMTAQRTIFVLVDENGDSTYDENWQFPTTIPVDSEAPPAVEDLEVSGVEDGVSMKWSLPDTLSGDIAGFQVLCATTTGEPVFDDPTDEPEYHSQAELCPGGPGGADAGPTIDAGPGVPDAGIPDAAAIPDAGPLPDVDPLAPDAGPDAAPGIDGDVDATPPPTGGFAQFDPKFICATEPAGATSTRVNLAGAHLGTDGQVLVRLIIFDANGNFTHLDAPNGAVSPTPVHDFWETYGDSGGQAEGGYCSVGGGAAGAGVALGGLALLAGAFVWLRRRKGGSGKGGGGSGPGTLMALIIASTAAAALLAGSAHAQPILDEDDEDNAVLEPPSLWVFELKFGPYVPNVDDEPGLTGTPYHDVFEGDWNLLTTIEVDRFFLFPMGQLGLAGQIGYMSDDAQSFMEDPSGNPLPTRSDDETNFNLMPTSLSAVYRFTMIADRTVVPLVPYAKLGLAYYIWWSTRGDGSTSSTPTNGDASGATLGWQGTIGVSFRADMLDPTATHNMRSELGVEHVGFFFEGTYADVSGLGMANKLYVGDMFWSAGVNFEF